MLAGVTASAVPVPPVIAVVLVVLINGKTGTAVPVAVIGVGRYIFAM
jgi:hypothetical protein